MPKIVAYHPTLTVSVGRQIHKIECVTDDYYPDAEVLAKLQDAYDARSPGDLVRAIKTKVLPDRSDILEARVA